MDNLCQEVKTKYNFSDLLEFAADNDVEGFKRSICDQSAVDEIGLWYGRQMFSKKMVIEERTPLMVAAKYGSVDIVKLILSLSEADLNFSCGPDESTALHCAASGGSLNATDVVKLLLQAGANPNAMDASGNRPFNVIVTPLDRPDLKVILEEILKNDVSNWEHEMQAASLPSLASSPDSGSLSSASDFILSPRAKPNETDASFVSEKREYPIDPTLPDIKSSIYATDEFRMFSFKIRPCSRAYSHDWTECPFAHPGENARRRDPRKYHYSCVPCPDFRKGTCKRGDMCEYGHGVFECWLHPAQYRTRLCKDGRSCDRRVCFFAHASEELRPLYVSTGSGVPSPRTSTTTMDMASILNMIPGSPSAAASTLSPSPFTPPRSPSGNGVSHSSINWVQQNIPALHLPGNNFQTSRLRSSFNSRDIPAERLTMLQDFHMHQQQQLLDELSCLTPPHFGTPSGNLSARTKNIAPSNLEELFSAEFLSPRYADQFASSLLSPSHKSMLLNQLQQKQSVLSPIKTNVSTPKSIEHPYLHASHGISSPGKMSPRCVEPISPMNSRMYSLSLHEKQMQQQFGSLSSREVGSNLSRGVGSHDVSLPGNPWSLLDHSSEKVDWSIQADELGRLRKSCSMGRNAEEPDVSWSQAQLKESSLH